ncbi:TonB-dependent receptor [Pleomorphovibrio marinus]|uniref:TonB-dependent receptor n=1 Tax=Pleomorphovibrio marinus TaxID=2164132 RepID=UPI000E0A5B79|nr:TonB-dependent receptor [Pleomorphovibrio marinus]
MKRKYGILCIWIAFISLICTGHVQAQEAENKLISGLFSGVSFERFAQMVEQRSPYQFFFDPEDIPELSININAYQNTLPQLLNQLFKDTDLHYVIDTEGRVFVTKGRGITLQGAEKLFMPATETDTLPTGEETGKEREERSFAKNRLWQIGSAARSETPTHARLSGLVTSFESGEPIIGAVIYALDHEGRTITDDDGLYSILLPKGRITLVIQSFGAYQEQRQVNLLGDGTLNIAMDDNIISLMEVTVTSEKSANIERPEMGLENISMQSMRKIPAVLGEVDVLRAVITLPGVQTVGEASAGFNVRGGAADQNLILYNNATIYNPTHLFGLFSAFNPDMMENVDLYKAGVPVQYGGRLSSVLDVKGKFGNKEKLEGGGGIGLMTSRLYLEGPLGEKTTFAAGGRSTYSNWLFGLMDEESEFRESRASFHDLNLNMSHEINKNNILKFSGYWSQDAFRFDLDTAFAYSNQNANLSWTHYFNDKLEGEMTIGHDRYAFSIAGELDPLNAFDFGFTMNQSHWRTHFNYDLDDAHNVSFGMNHVLYNLSPGSILPQGQESMVIPEVIGRERGLESAFYIGDEYEVNSKLLLNGGVRLVMYNYLGPNTVNQYPATTIRSEGTLIGQENYGTGEVIETYLGPEVRFSARYSLDNFTAIKAGFNTNRQHVNMLTNTAAIAPTDTWKLSDPHIRPQTGNQVSLGYFKNYKNNIIETSVEVYYRSMRNLVDFGSGANLILNESIEQDILNTEGQAYGVELMAKKTSGKLNGWISYTYSRSLLRTSPQELGEMINDGRWYPSNFDQPHDIMLVGNWEFTKRINTSINANYSTGRPITLPIAKFEYGGAERVFFSDRNDHRIPDYFRVDISFNLEGNHKIRKLAHASWSAGIYNVLGRANPYSVYFAPTNGVLQGYQLSIFAQPIPFITYNFKF